MKVKRENNEFFFLKLGSECYGMYVGGASWKQGFMIS